MAEFIHAFHQTHDNEGGYRLHKVPGDAGGWTFAGIARNFHPDWPGWARVFAGDRGPEVRDMVRDFYRAHYWEKINGDRIESQPKADRIYDFAVNAGWRTAARYAQRCAAVTEDGVIGPVTLYELNSMSDQLFLALYKLCRVEHRLAAVKRRSSQRKFLVGWLRRDLQGLKELFNT